MGLQKADLAQFFSPRSIAIVGVPRKGNRFGGLSYLGRFKEYGFPGRLYPINPNATEILGFKAYPSLQRAASALIHLHRYYSRFISPNRSQVQGSTVRVRKKRDQVYRERLQR